MQRLRETFRRQRQPTLEQQAQQHHQQIVQQQNEQQFRHQHQQEQFRQMKQEFIQQEQRQILSQEFFLESSDLSIDDLFPKVKSKQNTNSESSQPPAQTEQQTQQQTFYLLIPDNEVSKSRDQVNRFDDSQNVFDVPQQPSLNQISLNPNQLINTKQIRSVSYDEIRLRENIPGSGSPSDDDPFGDSKTINTLDVPSNNQRSTRSRSFDSATSNQSKEVTTPSSSTFLDVPKWKLLIRRSSSGSSSSSNPSSGFSGVKDCIHCILMEEYLKTTIQTSPPPSKTCSVSSEGSIGGDESDKEFDVESVTGEPGSESGSLGGRSGDSGGSGGDELEEDDCIVPLEGLPLVTLCPPPEINEIRIEEEEDSGSGITVVSLEVPILSNSKQVRSASVDSPYLLQVPQRTDIGDGETPPKASRSRSVDIVLPTTAGGPYLIVPPKSATTATTK